jgi:signal peptidase I
VDHPADGKPAAQQTLPVSLTGNSMYPFIREGDILFIRPVAPHQLRGGQIVVFALSETGRQWVAHRIRAIFQQNSEWMLLTQGDNVCRPDPPLKATQIIGQVIARVKKGKMIPVARWEELFCLRYAAWCRKVGRRSHHLRLVMQRIGEEIVKKIAMVNQDLIFRQEDQEGFIFDPNTGEIKLLNGTAIDIFQLLDGNHSRDDILDRLCQSYDAPKEQIENDLDEFLSMMHERKFLVEKDA